MNNLRIGLLERALQACANEYGDKGRTFTTLDEKAQNTTALAGALLAAALAFLQREMLEQFVQLGGWYVILHLGATIILLLAAIGSSLLAMRIRKVIAPLESQVLVKMVNDVLSIEPADFDDTTVENFMRDCIRSWQGALGDMSAANQSKARAVLIGQTLLALAIVAVGALLLIILINIGYLAIP